VCDGVVVEVGGRGGWLMGWRVGLGMVERAERKEREERRLGDGMEATMDGVAIVALRWGVRRELRLWVAV